MLMNATRARLRPIFFATAIVATVLTVASASAAAQTSPVQSVSVPFRGAVGENGYTSASASVSYAFIACQGEIHIAYSLANTPARVGSTYIFEGKSYPVTAAPPTLATIRFAGTVWRGPAQVGSFSDGLAAAALGMGCFSGQTQEVARVADVVGPNATQAQVSAYLGTLSIRVNTGEVLKSAAQESSIRTELRRAEAVAAAEKRRIEQQAHAEAEQPAAQQRAAQAQGQTAETVASDEAEGTSGQRVATGAPHPTTSRELTRDERIANAIASDKILADQRLQQQRDALAQQQARMAQAERQNDELAAAVIPQAVDLAANALGALEAWDERRKQQNYQLAQARLAGKCTLPNGLPSPKDGTIQLGVELTADLSKNDCGVNSADRYKAFKLELEEKSRLRFSVKAAKWRYLIKYTIDVSDLAKQSYMYMDWSEWGEFQKSNSKDVELPAGIYIVTVSNGTEDIFAGFDLRVDMLDASGNVIVARQNTVAPVAATMVEAPGPSPSSVGLSTAQRQESAAKPGEAYLGLKVAEGKFAIVTAVDPGSPAAGAGIVAGDEIMRMQTVPQGGYFVRSMDPKNQDHIDTWLRKSSPGKFAAFQLVRDGKQMWVTATLGTAH